MIKFETVRHMGAGESVPAKPRKLKVLAAAELLLSFDLEAGGEIVDVTQQQIMTRTQALFTMPDTSRYSGPEDEIRFLLKVAQIFHELGGCRHAVLNQLEDRERNSPGVMLLSVLTRKSVERNRTKERAILTALGYINKQEEILDATKGKDIDTFVSFLELIEEGYSIEGAREVL